MTNEAPRPWLEDDQADPALRALLSAARAQPGRSSADLARFATRMSALVGVDAALLQGSQLSGGIAPAQPGLPPLPAAVKVAAATGKALTAAGLAKVAAVSLALGASAWWVAQPAAPISSTRAPIVAQAPAVIEAPSVLVAPLAPVAATPEPATVVAPVSPLAKRRARAPAAEKVVAVPDELTLIREAQASRGRPGAVLERLAEHQKAYPAGLLSQEREVLAVEALLAAGQRSKAEARAAAFERTYPGSVHQARLRRMLAPGLSQ